MFKIYQWKFKKLQIVLFLPVLENNNLNFIMVNQ